MIDCYPLCHVALVSSVDDAGAMWVLPTWQSKLGPARLGVCIQVQRSTHNAHHSTPLCAYATGLQIAFE